MEQYVARINPDLPTGTPKRITLGWLPPGKKNTYDVEHGFVAVEASLVAPLRSVYSNGETLQRGGRGAKLFDVVTLKEAQELVAEEERSRLLSRGGSGVIHADLRAAAIEEAEVQARIKVAHQTLEARAGIAAEDDEPAQAAPEAPAPPPKAAPPHVAPTQQDKAAPGRVGRKRGK